MTGDHGGEHGAELFVVATPIGNLEDITLRALRVLREADIVAAEDTRIANRLLSHHGISQRPVALHQHNEKAMAERVCAWLDEGRRVALITDAGTPGLSDPGAVAVHAARERGHRVTPIPGASALAAALSVAGLPAGPVLFSGFLPASRDARRAAIAALERVPYALVFYEAPHRVAQTIEDLAAGLAGERTLVIARELTKLFETVHALPLVEASQWLSADPNRLRGEFVLLVSAPGKLPENETWQPVLEALLAELPLAQAVKLTCAATGARRKPVYERALAITGRAGDNEPL